jgi:hypothetical protein
MSKRYRLPPGRKPYTTFTNYGVRGNMRFDVTIYAESVCLRCYLASLRVSITFRMNEKLSAYISSWIDVPVVDRVWNESLAIGVAFIQNFGVDLANVIIGVGWKISEKDVDVHKYLKSFGAFL